MDTKVDSKDSEDKKRPRQSDSDCEATPKPKAKQVNMAGEFGPVDMQTILNAIQETKQGQDSLKSFVDSRLQKFKSDISKDISKELDEKIKLLRQDFDLEEFGIHD